jgi:cyclic nucleotide binding domain protein
MKEVVILLKKSILFENISDEEIEEILEKSNSKVVSIKKDEYLFYQEEESKNLFILIEGIVQIEKVDANGKRMIMNRFDEVGTMFAEVYVYFSDKLYDYSCIAVKNSKILAMPKEFLLNIDDLTQKYNYKLTQNMLKILSRKAFFLNQKVLILSSFTLRQKIASYLLQRVRECGLKGKPLDLLFKREELADFIGTTRPSLSREMLQMQDDGIIRLNKDTFEVIDLEKLKDLV